MYCDESASNLSSHLIDVKTAATLLRLKPSTMYNWISSGKYADSGLRRVKIGGKTFVDERIIKQILIDALNG